MFKLFKNDSSVYGWSKELQKDAELTRLDRLLKKQIKEKFSSSLKLYIVDSGSCSACELELQALFNPLYNISSMGIEVVYDATKADVLLITGLITENMYLELKEIYKKLKEPKRVMTIGDCPLAQAPFLDTFALNSQGINAFSASYHIRGCPPEPRELLRELLKYLKSL